MVRKNGIVGIGHCCQDTICTVENYPPEDGSTHILSMDDSQGGGAVATAMAAAATEVQYTVQTARHYDDVKSYDTEKLRSSFLMEKVVVFAAGSL